MARERMCTIELPMSRCLGPCNASRHDVQHKQGRVPCASEEPSAKEGWKTLLEKQGTEHDRGSLQVICQLSPHDVIVVFLPDAHITAVYHWKVCTSL